MAQSEYARGHGVRESRFDPHRPQADDIPNHAAYAALKAAEKYLEAEGVKHEHIVVLVRTVPAEEGERNGGTALSVLHDEDASPMGFASILVAHLRSIMQSANLTAEDLQ